MRRIKLTQDQYALVDNQDYERLSKHKWCACWCPKGKNFRAYRGVQRNYVKYTISMAREILGLQRGDKRHTDHINHNTLDNQRGNLRIVTNSQNAHNRLSVKGYSWHKLKKKWEAKIRVNYKLYFLGYFDEEKDARNAYLDAKKRLAPFV